MAGAILDKAMHTWKEGRHTSDDGRYGYGVISGFAALLHFRRTEVADHSVCQTTRSASRFAVPVASALQTPSTIMMMPTTIEFHFHA